MNDEFKEERDRVIGLLNATWPDLIFLIANGDEAASKKAQEDLDGLKEELVNLYAKKHEKNKYGVKMSELIKLGQEGFEKVEKRFDPAGKTPYGTFASWWVQQTMVAAINSKDPERKNRTYDINFRWEGPLHAKRKADNQEK
ncbi:MAG TPA: hypothetical protein VLG11_04105 [Candidatus Saccharimonadales bacterium]|nr:hypothetical protein [Candidatus Saccharimonadales bacterium]